MGPEEQLRRVAAREADFDEARAAVTGMAEALDRYAAAREALKRLSAYSDGGEWMRDFEADESGALPAGMKRGVLSEDALYDLLSDDREVLLRLLETAADILRG